MTLLKLWKPLNPLLIKQLELINKFIEHLLHKITFRTACVTQVLIKKVVYFDSIKIFRLNKEIERPVQKKLSNVDDRN